MMYDDGTEREEWDAVDLFDIEGCPEWANYAGADIDGYAHWFEYRPVRDTALNWVVVVGRVKAIPGRFGITGSPTDEYDMWQWDLEERSEDPNILLQPFTPDIFRIKNRPSWAKYAFMTNSGLVFWSENKPTERTETEWVFPECRTECLGYFNPKNWHHVMSLEFGKLPDPMTKKMEKVQKLTQEVFTRPETPHYAQYAAVDKDGTAHYFCGAPMIGYAQYPDPVLPEDVQNSARWEDPYVSDFERPVIESKFDASDWVNSVIMRNTSPLETPPELTKKVFDHPDCPSWAKYAAVDRSGFAYWFKEMPSLHYYKCMWAAVSDNKRIPGDYRVWMSDNNNMFRSWEECFIDRKGQYIEPVEHFHVPKRLHDDIFNRYNGLHSHYAAVDSDGRAHFFDRLPRIEYDDKGRGYWVSDHADGLHIPGAYNTENWQFSLVVNTCNPKYRAKLTQDVFDLPEAPVLAQYAAVDENGRAHYFIGKPTITKPTFPVPMGVQEGYFYWSDPYVADSERVVLTGIFDNKDWENSVIQRESYSDKYTKEFTNGVFKRPDCPKWAKYAAVDGGGIAHWYEEMPKIHECKNIWVNGGFSERIPGEFDPGLFYSNTVYDWCDCMIDREGNYIEPMYDHTQRLTKDIFKCYGCSEDNKYAAVNSDGTAHFFRDLPHVMYKEGGGYWFSEKTMCGFQVPGKFSPVEWDSSLVCREYIINKDTKNSFVKRDNNKEKEKIMYRDSKGRFAKKATPKYYNNRDAKGRFTRHMLKEIVKGCKECWEPEEPVIKEDGLTAEDYIAKGIDMIMDEMGYAVNDAKAHNVTITITVDGKDLDLI